VLFIKQFFSNHNYNNNLNTKHTCASLDEEAKLSPRDFIPFTHLLPLIWIGGCSSNNINIPFSFSLCLEHMAVECSETLQ
jgi:hypothetical protein